MSFAHYVFVGDFERDGEWVRYASTGASPILKPVVRRPIDLSLIRRLVGRVGPDTHDSLLPANWGMWLEGGYLGADRYGLTAEAVAFIARVVAGGGYEVVDDQSHLPAVGEWLAPTAGSVPAGVAASAESVAARDSGPPRSRQLS